MRANPKGQGVMRPQLPHQFPQSLSNRVQNNVQFSTRDQVQRFSWGRIQDWPSVLGCQVSYSSSKYGIQHCNSTVPTSL